MKYTTSSLFCLSPQLFDSHRARHRALAVLVTLTALLSACEGCKGDAPGDEQDMVAVGDMGAADLGAADASDDLPDSAGLDDGMTPGADMPVDADMQEPIVITPETPEQELLLAAPQQGEAWRLPGLTKPAHVVFTEMGRPHVYAEDELDMARVLGFVVARDRFFLMDLQRRLGQGRLSELLGDAALSNDVESRHTGMGIVTERLLANLSPEMEAYLDAYVSGINAYIDAVRAKKADPPSEFVTFKVLLGARKEADMMIPFTRRDVAAMVAVIMYETNFETGDVGRTARYARLEQLYQDDQAPLASLRRAGAVEDVWKRGIAPLFSASSVSGWTIEQGSGTMGVRRAPGQVFEKKAEYPSSMRLDVALLDRAHARLDALSERLGKRELDNFGSNTWAVAGTHSVDGSGIVAGDGHLPLDLPALMYQIGLDTKTFGPNAISDEGIRQTGLLITSLPILAVGTNGHIAWSQVNPFADITDWYLEELELDDDGLPLATRFEGVARPLKVVDEEYEIANVPILESVGRTETIRRYVTFDDRLIFDVEGDVYSQDNLPEGSPFVFNGSDYIVPADTNNDGVITAISFDYTAFDTTQYLDTLKRLSHARDVRQYQEQTRGFIGNMLYSAVTDSTGGILFTSYQAVPCRGYLARDANDATQWAPGAHPAMLLDGKTYKGFEIQSLANGFVDESNNQSDPYGCAVPFAETPQAIDPDEGFVFNGNNQPAPITDDASLGNDPWYIGGPWRAVRGDSIEKGLQAVTANKEGSIEAMAALQAERRSRTAEMFLDHFLGAIARAEALSVNPGGAPEEMRLVALYQANKAGFDEVYQRLSAWQMAGLHTDSGVDTFYNTSTPDSRQNAVATMIFNAWLPRVMQGTFNDETLEYYSSSSVAQMRTLKRMLDGRGDNSTALASYNEVAGESAFFDVFDTPEVEQSDEVILGALEGALAFLASPGDGEGGGGFGSAEMDGWLWGLRHQARFASILASFFGDTDFGAAVDAFSITTKVLPLAPELEDADPRKELKWFPRPGDNFAVDAANPGFSGTQFTHGSGPVMRMVISLKDGEVKGQNIIPGGQSAINDSEHFDDQVQLWLENKTIPLRYTPAEVAGGAVGRELFIP